MCQEENIALGEWVDVCYWKWGWAPQIEKCVGCKSLGMSRVVICGPIPTL